MKRRISLVAIVAMAMAVGVALPAAAAVKGNLVKAKLVTAQPFDWSAPDGFFAGHEHGNVSYTYSSSSFKGVLTLAGFKQAGPYVFTVDTADSSTLAGYGCDVWTPWTQLYGDTFAGGTNGCWNNNPYADVKLFTLTQYDSNHDGIIGGRDKYGGAIPFDVPLLNGTYNLKFFVKLDWQLTSPTNNIMMMNDMSGDPGGTVVKPHRGFDYSKDLVITGGLGAEELVLATTAWCENGVSWWPVPCDVPSLDPGYQGRTGAVFYESVSDTFRGIVVLSAQVDMPTPPWGGLPQVFQIKLEGMGSMSPEAASNEKIGYIGRWWDNDASPDPTNIDDSTYVTVGATHDVLGYVVFDGFDPEVATSKSFALNSSYHELWLPEPGRPTPGNVLMADGDYKVNFSLTENNFWWRTVFISENPVEFTIQH